MISLFNGIIPMIAIQLQAFLSGDQVSLVSTTVLTLIQPGLVDEDEDAQVTVDRSNWEAQASRASLQMADDLLALKRSWATDLDLSYRRPYVGFTRPGHSDNFVVFKPKKELLHAELRLDRSEAVQVKLD